MIPPNGGLQDGSAVSFFSSDDACVFKGVQGGCGPPGDGRGLLDCGGENQTPPPFERIPKRGLRRDRFPPRIDQLRTGLRIFCPTRHQSPLQWLGESHAVRLQSHRQRLLHRPQVVPGRPVRLAKEIKRRLKFGGRHGTCEKSAAIRH